MRSLLGQGTASYIDTPTAWDAKAKHIHRTFMQTLGQAPPRQTPIVTIVQTQSAEDVTLTLMHIQVDDDDIMEAWLIEPRVRKAETRVALALHQTIDDGKDEVTGLAGSPDLAYGRELARRGWTVLAPDHFALTRRYAKGLRAFDTARFYERYPKWSAVGKTLADAQAALDVLDQLPQTTGRPIPRRNEHTPLGSDGSACATSGLQLRPVSHGGQPAARSSFPQRVVHLLQRPEAQTERTSRSAALVGFS